MVEVTDILGRKVKSLVSRNVEPGILAFAWNGSGDQNQHLTSGIYFIKATDGIDIDNTRVILIK
jgi:flagellar hook assembly protein FlgD